MDKLEIDFPKLKLDGFGELELEGFEDLELEEFNLELKKFTFIDNRSIGNINRAITLLETMKPSKEVTQCIQLLKEVKDIEGVE
jgi:hypothetical protein